jgi:hypothetical protein
VFWGNSAARLAPARPSEQKSNTTGNRKDIVVPGWLFWKVL